MSESGSDADSVLVVKLNPASEEDSPSSIDSSEESSNASPAKCKKIVCKKSDRDSHQCLKQIDCKKDEEPTSEEVTSDSGKSSETGNSGAKQKCKAKSHSEKSRATAAPSSEEQSTVSSGEPSGDDSQATDSEAEPSAHTSSDVSEEPSKGDSTSEGNSTEAESSNASSNAEPSSNSAMNAGADTSGWTLSEDLLLRSMKTGKENLSWADIDDALKRHKNDVKARWKVVKDLPHKAGSDGDDGEQTDADSTPPETGERKEKGKKGKQAAEAATHTPEASNPKCLSGDEASSEASDNPLSYVSREKRRQDRYLRKHIWAELYPSSLQPQPDEHFDKDDCAVLAAADSRYKHVRWLEMQANFYNVTGRMVPLDVIRARCERADDARTETVQQWVDGVSRES